MTSKNQERITLINKQYHKKQASDVENKKIHI